jgi:hypothetical protein
MFLRKVTLLILFSVTQLLSYTSVVVFRTNAIVVIGADSKVHSAESSATSPTTRCKIGVANKIAWAYARILSAPGYDVEPIAHTAITWGSGTLSERVYLFERLLLRELGSILVRVRQGDPLWWYTEGSTKPALDIVFAGFENGNVSLFYRSFVPIRGSPHGTVFFNIEREDYRRPLTDTKYAALGFNEAVKQDLDSNPSAVSKEGFVAAVQRLVGLEILAVPSEVGPPIAVVTIDAGGVHWIHKGVCP